MSKLLRIFDHINNTAKERREKRTNVTCTKPDLSKPVTTMSSKLYLVKSVKTV